MFLKALENIKNKRNHEKDIIQGTISSVWCEYMFKLNINKNQLYFFVFNQILTNHKHVFRWGGAMFLSYVLLVY